MCTHRLQHTGIFSDGPYAITRNLKVRLRGFDLRLAILECVIALVDHHHTATKDDAQAATQQLAHRVGHASYSELVVMTATSSFSKEHHLLRALKVFNRLGYSVFIMPSNREPGGPEITTEPSKPVPSASI
jgi:hypothetical protein